MSEITIDVEELDGAVAKILKEYDTQVVDGMKMAAKEAIEECDNVIHNSVSFEQITGKYVGNFSTKKVDEDPRSITYAWYVEDPEYRLAHLLEKGHRTRVKSGSYGSTAHTRAYPHIKLGEKAGKKYFQKRLTEVISGDS
jgi:hypothetical protein